MTGAVVGCCPTCGSTDPNVCSTSCYNAWHRGTVVHPQREPAETPGAECSAACHAPIDDPRSRLAVDREFVEAVARLAELEGDVERLNDALTLSHEDWQEMRDGREQALADSARLAVLHRAEITCAQCCSQMITQRTIVVRHQELSDEDIERASLDELRAAYRSLRDHHVAETTALVSRHDVIVEIIDFMSNHYSPIGGRACALCVYEDGRFIRSCALHRWDDTAGKVLASRAADPEDPMTTDHLSDEELAAWAESAGVYKESMEGSYLRMIVDDLRERRDAETIFAEVDGKFQGVDCRTCDDEGADNCEAHKSLVRQWRSARAALCDLARIHRGYLRILNAPSGGDPQ